MELIKLKEFIRIKSIVNNFGKPISHKNQNQKK